MNTANHTNPHPANGLEAFWEPLQQEALHAVAAHYGSIGDIVFGAHLAALAGAAMQRYRSKLGNWEVLSNLYIAMVGSVGCGKTVAIDIAFRSLERKIKPAIEMHNSKVREWEYTPRKSRGEKPIFYWPHCGIKSVADLRDRATKPAARVFTLETYQTEDLIKLFGNGRSARADDLRRSMESLYVNDGTGRLDPQKVYENGGCGIATFVAEMHPSWIAKVINPDKQYSLFWQFLLCWPEVEPPLYLHSGDMNDPCETDAYVSSITAPFDFLNETLTYPFRLPEQIHVPFLDDAARSALDLYNALEEEEISLYNAKRKSINHGDRDFGLAIKRLKVVFLRFALLSAVNRAALEKRQPEHIDVDDVWRAYRLVLYFKNTFARALKP